MLRFALVKAIALQTAAAYAVRVPEETALCPLFVLTTATAVDVVLDRMGCRMIVERAFVIDTRSIIPLSPRPSMTGPRAAICYARGAV